MLETQTKTIRPCCVKKEAFNTDFLTEFSFTSIGSAVSFSLAMFGAQF